MICGIFVIMNLNELNVEDKLQRYMELNTDLGSSGIEYIPNGSVDKSTPPIDIKPPALSKNSYNNMAALFNSYAQKDKLDSYNPMNDSFEDAAVETLEKTPTNNAWTLKRTNEFANLPKGQAAIIKSIDDLKNVGEEDKYFLKRLAKRESTFNPNASITDKKGRTYTGLYQFGDGALGSVGMTKAQYRGDINNQHLAALKFGEQNIKGLEGYIGKTVKGVRVTKAGMMAAAHLGGRGGLQALLQGKERKDMLGTSTLDYLKMFEN